MEYSIARLGLIEDETIDLDTAALELASLDHPEVDLDPYFDTLGDIAERVASLGADALTPHERAHALSAAIAGEHAFEGDTNTYDNSENTDLIRVMDRKRGLPVSLTILYVAAARRIGWHADVLNTPGHVLGRIGRDTSGANGVGPEPGDGLDDQAAPVLIDPFHRGAVVDQEHLVDLIGGVLGPHVIPAPEHLAAMSNRAVLTRLLMNQASRAERNGNLERALVVYARMTTIAPTHVHAWWERARLEAAGGQKASARASLSAILEITRDDDLRGNVYAALDDLSTM